MLVHITGLKRRTSFGAEPGCYAFRLAFRYGYNFTEADDLKTLAWL